MKFDIAVKMADELVYAKTGERLDDLHLSIFEVFGKGKDTLTLLKRSTERKGISGN